MRVAPSVTAAPRKMGLNVIQDARPEGVPHGLVTGLNGGTDQRGSGSSNGVRPASPHRQGAVRPHGPEQVTEVLLLCLRKRTQPAQCGVEGENATKERRVRSGVCKWVL